LGTLISARLFISSEILAETTELGIIEIVGLATVHHDQIRDKARYGLTGLLTALGVASTLLAYPISFAVFGPEHGKNAALSGLYSGDLVTPIVPTSNQLLTTPALSRLGEKFSGGSILFGSSSHVVTNAAYLGIPLILFVVATALIYRRLELPTSSFGLVTSTCPCHLGPATSGSAICSGQDRDASILPIYCRQDELAR